MKCRINSYITSYRTITIIQENETATL